MTDNSNKIPTQKCLSCTRLNRCIEYVEENIGRPISLADLADAAALSPFHFSRTFKRSLGVGPKRYILNQRIEAAKAMLAENPDATQAEVAYACGFASQSHFCTSFKAATGMTAASWRRVGIRAAIMAAVLRIVDAFAPVVA